MREVPLYRGTMLISNCPPPVGPPQEPRHGPTVGSYGLAISDVRGTPVLLETAARSMVHPDCVKPPQLFPVPPPYRGTSLIRNRHTPIAPP